MTDDPRGGLNAPSYAQPPLIEVALGVTFRPLAALDFGMLADLRTRWSGQYPVVQQQLPIAPAADLREGLPPVMVQVGAPPIRLWFMTEDEDRVVQVQHDRLIVNWRVGDGSSTYPRYDALRIVLEDRLDDLARFLDERDTGTIKPLSTELTYTNVIQPAEGQQAVPIDQVIAAHRSFGTHLGEPARSNATYLFDTTGTTGHRSQITVAAGVDATREPSPLLVQISAQGLVDRDVKQAFAALDVAHIQVVQLFDEITTEEMHEHWGRSI